MVATRVVVAVGCRPAASACVRAEMEVALTRGARPVSSCSISSGRAATASRKTSRMAGERDSVLSRIRFSRFSMDQANSPRSRAPTMRPLPFNVWKERRTVIRDSRSSGFWSHAGKPLAIFTNSSWASSMKSFTSSGSADSARAATMAVRDGDNVGGAPPTAVADGSVSEPYARPGPPICTVRANDAGSRGGTIGTWGACCCSRACTQAWALSSMYQGSLRPACSVSM